MFANPKRDEFASDDPTQPILLSMPNSSNLKSPANSVVLEIKDELLMDVGNDNHHHNDENTSYDENTNHSQIDNNGTDLKLKVQLPAEENSKQHFSERELQFLPHRQCMHSIERMIEDTANDTPALVIFLHGLGDNGFSWKQAFLQSAKKAPNIKWIFPTAAQAPVTFQGLQRKTFAWHDIVSLYKWQLNADFVGRSVSVAFITQLIHDEIEQSNGKLTPEKIIVGGFSMGAAIALYTALTSDLRIGGCICLSGYWPELILNGNQNQNGNGNANDTDGLTMNINARNKDMPILMYHSKQDGIVLYKYCLMTVNGLKQHGCTNVVLKHNGVKGSVFNNMGHCTNEYEMKETQTFILDALMDEKYKAQWNWSCTIL